MNRALIRLTVLLAILTMICVGIIVRGPHLLDPAVPGMLLPEPAFPETNP
jgi:hypothetical protein